MKRHLAALVLALSLVLFQPVMGDLKEARISSVTDGGVDEDGDGHFESLEISVTVSVFMEGSYRAVADLEPSGVSLYSYSPEVVLTQGSHELLLYFPAQELYSRGVEGTLVVHVSLFKGGELLDDTNHTTHYYPAEAFSPPTAKPYPTAKVSLSESTVTLYTEMVTVSVNTSRPVFRVGYTAAPYHTMTVIFDRVEVVEDSGDGLPGEGDQVIATGSLMDTVWELNSRFEGGYEGELSSVVPLLGPGGVQLALMQFSIYFEASNLSLAGYYLTFRASMKIIGEIEGDFITLILKASAPGEYSMRLTQTGGGYELTSKDGGRQFLVLEELGIAKANLTGEDLIFNMNWTAERSFTFRLGVDPTSIPEIGRRGQYLKNSMAYMLLGALLSSAAVGATLVLQYRRGRG